MPRDFMTVDTRQIKAFERGLEAVGVTVKTAERRAINSAAFMARGEWQSDIGKQFVSRNKFTQGAVRVEMARRDGEGAVVGSIAPYMDEQEFGGTSKRPVVTPSATGEGDTAFPRKKYPTLTSPNRMKNIRLSKGPMRVRGKVFNPSTKKQEIFLRIREAATRKEKYIHLDMPGKRGIYRLTMRGRVNWTPTRTHGPGEGIEMKMIYSMVKPQLRIPRHATLLPVVHRVEKRLPVIYRATMQKIITQTINKAMKKGHVKAKGIDGKFRAFTSIQAAMRGAF
jgi:hypothetical protein